MCSELPTLLHRHLRASRYYAHNTDSIVIQADSSRKQDQNVDDCMQKLKDEICKIAHRLIPGETSPEKQAKVQGMIKANDLARIKSKKLHSGKKSARRSSSSKSDY